MGLKLDGNPTNSQDDYIINSSISQMLWGNGVADGSQTEPNYIINNTAYGDFYISKVSSQNLVYLSRENKRRHKDRN